MNAENECEALWRLTLVFIITPARRSSFQLDPTEPFRYIYEIV
jgi:hypothetical protein